MKIVACFGQGEPPYTSARSLVSGLHDLGHEVLTCGPPYWGRGEDADIVMDDRPFPERYSYEEVLSRCSGTVDLILQIEPHFYLSGQKPPEIRSAYYFTDPHRGGLMCYTLAHEGNFDIVFVGQQYFINFYKDLPGRVEFLPLAFDSHRFHMTETQKIWWRHPTVDISFVGQTGITGMEFPYEDGVGKYATKPPANLPADFHRYAFCESLGFDYAERAEMLIRLCRDFQVRIYDSIYDDIHYHAALRAGAIGFNRSLLHDVAIRNFEVLAADRLLLTDRVPYIGNLLIDGAHCRMYDTFYKPFFPNFDLEYKEVYKLVKYYLEHDTEREDMAGSGYRHVWQHHRWIDRARTLLNLL